MKTDSEIQHDLFAANSDKPRWCCHQHAYTWAAQFQTAFPAKAYLAFQALADLSGYDSPEAMDLALPAHCSGEDTPAIELLERFTQDRLALVNQFDIHPIAANHFLDLCPIGSPAPALERATKIGVGFDETQCYLNGAAPNQDDVLRLIKDQLIDAKGRCLKTAGDTDRLGSYLPPAAYADIFQFHGWDFRVDTTSPADQWFDTRGGMGLIAGELQDHDLGAITCYLMPFTVSPAYVSDELFIHCNTTLHHEGHKLSLMLNNKPSKFVVGERQYTLIGFFSEPGSPPSPCFLPSRPTSLAELRVEGVLFNGNPIPQLEDVGGDRYLRLAELIDASDCPEPSDNRSRKRDPFFMLPNGWQIAR